MKTHILLYLLVAFSCTTNKISERSIVTDKKDLTIVNKDSIDSSYIATCRYYYDRFFSSLVEHSLTNEFNIDNRFGSENTYSILKATNFLAMHGDTLVRNEMVDFLKSLANRNEDYEVDHSIYALIQFLAEYKSKEIFESSLEFLNPKHIFKGTLSPDYGSGDYTSLVFTELLKSMTTEDRSYYGTVFTSYYKSTIKKHNSNTSLHLWNEFYPYILKEYNQGNIEFIAK